MNRFLLVFVFVALSASPLAYAQVYPSGFAQVKVVGDISNPTVMAFAPDGRIFVAEQGGKLRVVKNGTLLSTPFITLNVDDDGERGLIGIAFDPDFTTNQYIYLYYTVSGSPAHNRISRFTANGDVVVSESESIVLDLTNLSGATNHNGGALSFGPDGKLYVAVGENATGSNAQNLDNYLGKILRINKDGSAPADNPFTTGSESKKRIWQYGLRNPYTISFQPGTGKFFINDVGQSTWEEINDGTVGGKNFGWPTAEGVSTNTAFTNAVYNYAHGSGDGVGCAITGGTFFNPSSTNYPSAYFGKYFFLDYCNNWINYIDFSGTPAVKTPFATAIASSAVSLMTGPDGNLYFLSRNGAGVYKIVYNNSTAPTIVQLPQGKTVSQGDAVTFSVSAIGSAPLTYQWQQDGKNVGTNSATLTLSNIQPSNAGKYKVIVSNSINQTTSTEVTLTVLQNTLPSAKITSPIATNKYNAGTTIAYAGTGTDAEEGELSASVFSWQIDFHHDVHKHDQPAVTGAKSGVFAVPDQGETSANVWYRFILSVKDSKGAVGKDSVDIYPNKVMLRFATNPSGLQITLDGQPLLTPDSVQSVVGIKRALGIITPQTDAKAEYHFESWAHGGEDSQTISTPAVSTKYQANFQTIVGTGDSSTEENIMVYPSPASGEWVTLKINAKQQQQTVIRCMNMHASAIQELNVSLSAGENKIPVSINNLRPGLYHLSFLLDGKQFGTKVMIAR